MHSTSHFVVLRGISNNSLKLRKVNIELHNCSLSLVTSKLVFPVLRMAFNSIEPE